MKGFEYLIISAAWVFSIYWLLLIQRRQSLRFQQAIERLNIMDETTLETKLNSLAARAAELLASTEERLRSELISHRERLYHANTQHYNQQMEAQKLLRETLNQSYSRLREDLLVRLSQMQEQLTMRQTMDLKTIRSMKQLSDSYQTEFSDELM